MKINPPPCNHVAYPFLAFTNHEFVDLPSPWICLQPYATDLDRGPHKVLPMCSRLLGRLPSDETPGVSSPGCALMAVRACLLVLLCCVQITKFSTRHLPYPVYPTVVPSVRYTSSTLSCL
jgi:hypothetical protein